MSRDFFVSALHQFRDYKNLGEKAMAQLTDDQIFQEPAIGCNSIAIIVRHLHGNMKSRWTNFLTEDGEKPDRDRDGEFIYPERDREAIDALWQEGWSALFNALENLDDSHLTQVIYIRTKPLTVLSAVHRQLAHYGSHVGQIILLGKIFTGENWHSLSIPRGDSAVFNEKMKGRSG